MGGQTSSTTQPNGLNLAQLFGQQTGYQQTPIAPISAPQYPAALSPSLEDAAAATRARMAARTPVAAPAVAPRRQMQMGPGGGNGGGARGAASGGNGNGWGGH